MPEEETQMSRSSWERERAADLATRDALKLAEKAAGLEYDLRTVRQERDALKAALPPEGSVMLARQDAEKWAAYQALGKVDDLKTAVTERDSFRSDLSGRDRRDLNRTAADAAGYRPGVLEKLLPADAVTSVRDVQVDGRPVKTAFVTIAGTERPLSEWATSEHADFMPSLAMQPQTAVIPAASWVPQPTATPAKPEGQTASPWAGFLANREAQNSTK